MKRGTRKRNAKFISSLRKVDIQCETVNAQNAVFLQKKSETRKRNAEAERRECENLNSILPVRFSFFSNLVEIQAKIISFQRS